MNKLARSIRSMLIGLCAMGFAAAMAADPEEEAPTQYVGEINAVHPGGVLIIDDVPWRLPPGILIRNETGAFLSVKDLRPGDNITVHFKPNQKTTMQYQQELGLQRPEIESVIISR